MVMIEKAGQDLLIETQTRDLLSNIDILIVTLWRNFRISNQNNETKLSNSSLPILNPETFL